MKKYAMPCLIVAFLILVLGFTYFSLKKNNKIENKPRTTASESLITTAKEKQKENIMDGIEINYHASIKFNKNEKIIYFDPYKIDRTLNDADYVFITHSHYDHYSPNDIKKVMKNDTKFVITSDLEDKIVSLGVSINNILTVYPNENYTLDDLTFSTIPSYNINTSYHKKSYNWVGYNVKLDGYNYYIVGDSDVTEELKKVKCDVIFIPVGGTYTMDYKDAALAVNEMKVKYAVPIHYGVVGSINDAESFVNSLDSNIKGVILKK